MTAVVFDRLTVRYGRHVALSDFTDDVTPGEWVCVIGPNGAGKSSLLRALAGVVPYEGSVFVDGSPLARRSVRRRAQLIGYVPQNPSMPPDMTARQYVGLGRNPFVAHFGRETRHDSATVEEVLERLGLAEFAGRMLGSLSGGERQRLVIARAVAQEARVLLLDEPTSALDIGHQQQALELVDHLRRAHGLTVISAMHDLTLAGTYSDRMILVHEGHKVAAGTPEEVLRAETLAEFYRVSVDVRLDDDGSVVVIPRRTGRP